MSFIVKVLIWIILNILLVACMDFALFTQTTFDNKNNSLINKIITSEFWATIEWMFVIPAQRIGYTFLNPAQLDMSSYIFDFLGQIVSNIFWLKIPTFIDDYIAMVFILLGMYITTYRVFG